jgi:hypothetical protein
MENRWSTRKTLKGDAVVEGPGLGRVQATLRDVSLGGALVETGDVSLPLNAPVSVAFNLSPGDDHRGDYRLHATVVRRDASRVGLLFQDLDTETIRSLRATLYGPAVPLSSPPGAWDSRAA